MDGETRQFNNAVPGASRMIRRSSVRRSLTQLAAGIGGGLTSGQGSAAAAPELNSIGAPLAVMQAVHASTAQQR